MTALHARPGGDLRALTHRRLLNQPLTRIALPIRAQHKRNEWHLRLSRCSAVFRQFAAAGQSQWQDVRSSLCIGVGAGALACTGGSGPNGPSPGAGGSGGSGGDGWHAGPGHSSISNVLSDVAAVNDGSSNAAEQVILLDVGGMKCGGCVSHVKKLLEQHPAVQHATVNLATETALVRVTLAQGADLDKLAAELAKGLTKQGFSTSARERRGSGWVSETALNHKRQQKLDKLSKTTKDLAVAWGLSLLCGLGHLAHLLPNAPGWMHVLHHPALAATLSAAALLGPGRDIITAGWQALSSGRPDMNSLVGLGATASFAVSCVAAGLPALRWKTFFEEPAMLLGFVLVGRALEERAKLQASSDMAALQCLMPQTARLALGYSRSADAAAATSAATADQHAALGSTTSSTRSSTTSNTGATSSSSSTDWVEVPADAVGPGDVLIVLPGDRVPVDGAVLSGRSTVDESALTGEPLPLVKQTGSKVTAGTLNCDGSLLVSAEASGQDTVIADIVRLVESAQARTAPIQRLADTVAGKFAYGVMGISAATFAFWSTVGAKAFPGVLTPAAAAAGACCPPVAGAAAAGASVMPAAAAVLLGLQLACNVIVVACPCALGLATPTAVLVGTAAGARKGLLVRGGDILEATSQVDTVVFDKTGTLTAGKPVVAGITMLTALSSSSSSNSNGHLQQADNSSSRSISPRLLLQLAAAVEQQTTHPVGKALVAAAAADRAAVTAAAVGSMDEQQQLQERKLTHAEASVRSSSSSSSRDKHAQHQQYHHSSSTNLLDSLEAAAQAGSSFITAEGTFLQEPGSGAVAVVEGHKVSVGTREWVERQGAALTAAGQQLLQMQQQGLLIKPGSANIGHNGQQLQQQVAGMTNPSETLTGHTQVFVGIDDQIVGLLDVADMIRSDARSTIQELQQQRIKTIMLSGDRKEAAIKVAAAVGIAESDVYAGIKPAGKAVLVEDLKRSGHRVAMVGDGINDTAALAAADVGMAMAGGVDAASDVSKVVLMGDQLHQVADAIELSKKTLRKIQQNLGWAFCYNLVGIPLAAGVLLPKYGIALTPSISGALMGFSSLAVMANSLLLQLEVRGMRNGLTSGGNAAKTLQPAHPAAAAAFTAAVGGSSSRDRASVQQHQGQQQGRLRSSTSSGCGAVVGSDAVVIDLAAAAATSPAAAAGDS